MTRKTSIDDRLLDKMNLTDSKELLRNLLQENKKLEHQLKKMSRKNLKAVKQYEREEELKPFQAELISLQRYLEDQGKRMIILFEGRDAAGKGGTIRRVTRYMNEKHYRVVALGKPTEQQRSQWYYQKYIENFPRGGEIVLFDRSWYNRAMVERVFNFCSEKEYNDFMVGVPGFENDLLRQGTILLKIYFSVSKDEQAQRFKRRQNDNLRQWKLSEMDLQVQDKWDDFTQLKYDMLQQTSTETSPWVIIRSDNKHQARLNALKVILSRVDFNHNPDLDITPDSNIVISSSQEMALMEDEYRRITNHSTQKSTPNN